MKHLSTICGLLCLISISCTNDLDVTPINPQQTMDYNQDALFNKIYASFCLTGQVGPAGNGDVPGDEGQSEFFRMLWYLNEFTTDEAHWVWATAAILMPLNALAMMVSSKKLSRNMEIR